MFQTTNCPPLTPGDVANNRGLRNLMVDSTRIYAVCGVADSTTSTFFRFPKNSRTIGSSEFISPTDKSPSLGRNPMEL